MRRRKFTPPDDAGLAEDDPYDEPTLGPDERDRDLIDGSWEKRYYQGRVRQRDWNSVTLGVVLLVLIALILPMFLVFFQ